MPPARSRESRLHYPDIKPPANAAMVDLPGGLRWVRLPVPGGLSHINVWLIPDCEGWTLVDTGMGIPAVTDAWQGLLGSLTDRPITRIIVTHHHPDHFGQANHLSAICAAPVWMTDAELDSAIGPRHLDPAERARRRQSNLEANGLAVSDDIAPFLTGEGYRRIISGVPERIRPIRDGETITIGKCAWQVIVTPGHASGHAALFCAETRMLISGDHVLPTISPNISLWSEDPDADPLGDFLGSFERFRALPADTFVLPSHGRVFRGLHDRVDELESEHDAVLETAVAACTAPISAGDLIPILFPRKLDPLNTLLAFGETLAHLRYLSKRRRLAKIADNDGVKYQRTT